MRVTLEFGTDLLNRTRSLLYWIGGVNITTDYSVRWIHFQLNKKFKYYVIEMTGSLLLPFYFFTERKCEEDATRSVIIVVTIHPFNLLGRSEDGCESHFPLDASFNGIDPSSPAILNPFKPFWMRDLIDIANIRGLCPWSMKRFRTVTPHSNIVREIN